jgi:hypothetical protein
LRQAFSQGFGDGVQLCAGWAVRRAAGRAEANAVAVPAGDDVEVDVEDVLAGRGAVGKVDGNAVASQAGGSEGGADALGGREHGGG